MKFVLLAAAAAIVPALAQNTTDPAAYLQTVLGALTGAGLTSLVTVASAIANTTDGAALLASLAQGNRTVFAPINSAFDAVPQNVSSNTTLLTQILSYHILTTAYTPSGVAVTPAHTIGRTALRAGQYALPANRTQPIVLTRANSTANNTITILLSDGTNVTAQGPVSAANLQVYTIPSVLSLPPTIAEAAPALFPSLAGVVQQSGLLEPLAASREVTLFAPQDAALAAVQSTLATLNSTQVQAVLLAHVINGTSVFSTGLTTSNYTSASGQPLMFASNSSGAFVMSGNVTARIIRADIPIANGVVHVIDNVLANPAVNQGAAQSAYEANTAAAATSPTQTGVISATSQPAASGGASGSAAASSRAAGDLVASLSLKSGLLGAVVGVVGLAVGGGLVLA